MYKFILLLVVIVAPAVARAQTSDTITLTVGHPSVDGSIYKEHWATATRSLLKDGAVVRTITYRSHTYITRQNGVPVVIVASEPGPETQDRSFRDVTVLDLRTTALLHHEDHDGSGRMSVVDVKGTHVTGRLRASREAPVDSLDFTLDTPAYYAPFVDAAIGATQIHAGQVWRVPMFSLGPNGRKVEWHSFHIVGHEPVPALAESIDAWVIEDDAPARTKIWITYEPPYLPQVLHYSADGSISRFASTLANPSGVASGTAGKSR